MTDERETKAHLRPMRCYPYCHLREAPHIQFQKDAFKPGRLQAHGITLDQERKKRDVERETIFIMEQHSLTGKRNYGQTVATA